jgi:hypothetical protein
LQDPPAHARTRTTSALLPGDPPKNSFINVLPHPGAFAGFLKNH